MSYRNSRPCTIAPLVAVFVLGSSYLWATPQEPSPRPGRDEAGKAAVELAYKAYLRAWQDKDYAALDRLLSDDYQAVNFKGIVSTKANEIATAREDRDYETLTSDVIFRPNTCR